jgi:hypothetical protein
LSRGPRILQEYSNWPTIPQVYVNGEFIGGCDIMINLHKSGELVDILKGIHELGSFVLQQIRALVRAFLLVFPSKIRTIRTFARGFVLCCRLCSVQVSAFHVSFHNCCLPFGCVCSHVNLARAAEAGIESKMNYEEDN